METAEDTKRNRGSYYVITGEMTEIKTQAELKKHIANNPMGSIVIKGKPVNVIVENKPVISISL